MRLGSSHWLGWACAGALVLALPGVAVAAPAGWTPPRDLSDNFEVGFLEEGALNFPDIDVSDGGDAVAIWRRQEQLPDLTHRQDMWTADLPLGGTWSAPRFVGTGVGDAWDPKVATNAGTTVIAWASGSNIVARVRRGGGAYSPERNLGAGSDVQVGVDDAGTAFVLWQSSGIKAARNSAAGWTTTTTISTSPTAQTPDLAVSGSGDAVGSWKAQDGIRVTEFTPQTGWTPHYLVGPGGIRPSVAINDGDQVVLAWTLEGPPDSGGLPTQSVQVKTGSVWGGLGAARKISDDISYDIWLQEPTPVAAINARGDMAVGWNRAVYPGTQSTVQVTMSPGLGGWTSPQNIAVPISAPKPALAVLPDGSAIAVWKGGNAALRPSDGGGGFPPARFGAPFVLAGPEAEVDNPAIATDDAGRIHVVWADTSRPQTRYDDRLGFMAVQATSFGAAAAGPAPGGGPGPVSASPAPPGGGAPPLPKLPGGLQAGAPAALAKPRLATVLRRGTLYLKVTATLSRAFSGRTLVIQRRAGTRVLRMGSLAVPRSGRISRLIALDTNSSVGGTGVRHLARIQVRMTLTKTRRAAAISSPFGAVGV